MNERQHGGNLIRAGRPHCAWLELALAGRSPIVSGTGQKTLPGPREPYIIQRACLKKRVELGRVRERKGASGEGGEKKRGGDR